MQIPITSKVHSHAQRVAWSIVDLVLEGGPHTKLDLASASQSLVFCRAGNNLLLVEFPKGSFQLIG